MLALWRGCRSCAAAAAHPGIGFGARSVGLAHGSSKRGFRQRGARAFQLGLSLVLRIVSKDDQRTLDRVVNRAIAIQSVFHGAPVSFSIDSQF
eukprot:SAG25_NODE_5986_length_599_cov_0.952000_2_plen_93_part_00